MQKLLLKNLLCGELHKIPISDEEDEHVVKMILGAR